MTVYVITEGSYSDYHIIAVAVDKTKAERLAKVFDADVEEWETDTVRDRKAIDGFRRYRIAFNFSGDVYWTSDYTSVQEQQEGVEERHTDWWRERKISPPLDVTVWARNKREAIKIAAEKRAQYLAEKEGLT